MALFIDMMPKFNDFVAFSLVLVFILEGGRRGVQFFILPMVSGLHCDI